MNSPKLKIAIVVQGRFYAFDLARELIRQEHEVILLTNYPKFTAEKFDIPSRNVRSFLSHGILSRIISFFHQRFGLPDFEAWLHMSFSRWASRQLVKENWDVVKVFSGIAEEIFESIGDHCKAKILVRGSSHIRTQSRLLEEEERRAGVKIERPSSWMIAREEREYKLADYILALSTFAKESFIEEGCSPAKLRVLFLGADLSRFRPGKEIIQQRKQRVLSGSPLRVLTVGTFSMRKGALDLVKIASSCSPALIFRFVGAVADEAKALLRDARFIERVPKQFEFDLPSCYAWADLFLFPTVEDGYAVVLAQAQAAGLPILTTSHSSGPDLIRSSQTGWVLPVHNPDAFTNQLNWCDHHREGLAQMLQNIYEEFQLRDWSSVAHDFISICRDFLANKA